MDKFLLRLEEILADFDCSSDNLKSELKKLMFSNPKRLRPKLAYLIVKAHGEELNPEQEQLIAGGELMHTASLIHDDIIDNSNLRRGIETLNTTYDSKLAVISGDLLAAAAMDKFIELGNIKILRLFRTAFNSMCNAEIQQYFDRGKIPQLDSYIEKTKNKTGSLFGAILAGTAILAKHIEPELMYELGQVYGTAFQIKNDIVSYEQINSTDRQNGIYTAPDIFYNQDKNIQHVIEKTYSLIDNEVSKILRIINPLTESTYKNELIRTIKESLCRAKK